MVRLANILAGILGLLFANCSANHSGEYSSNTDSVVMDSVQTPHYWMLSNTDSVVMDSVKDPFLLDVINPIHDFTAQRKFLVVKF